MKNISLSNIKLLKNKAIDILKKSVDPAHDLDHAYSVRNHMRSFAHETSLAYPEKDVIDLTALWHDTWRSKVRPNYRYVNSVLTEMVEGFGSMFLFIKNAKGRLDPAVLGEVSYAIRKHSTFNLIPAKTVLGKILRDADKLEILNPKRIIKIVKDMKGNLRENLDLTLNVISFYEKFPMQTDWGKSRFTQMRKRFIEEMKVFNEISGLT